MEPQTIIYIQRPGAWSTDNQTWITWCNERVTDGDIEYIRRDIFDAICKYVAYESGACPADMLLGWEHPGKCEKVCKNQAAECWGLFFIEKAMEKSKEK
jgi:hypothetical protein